LRLTIPGRRFPSAGCYSTHSEKPPSKKGGQKSPLFNGVRGDGQPGTWAGLGGRKSLYPGPLDLVESLEKNGQAPVVDPGNREKGTGVFGFREGKLEEETRPRTLGDTLLVQKKTKSSPLGSLGGKCNKARKKRWGGLSRLK